MLSPAGMRTKNSTIACGCRNSTYGYPHAIGRYGPPSQPPFSITLPAHSLLIRAPPSSIGLCCPGVNFTTVGDWAEAGAAHATNSNRARAATFIARPAGPRTASL